MGLINYKDIDFDKSINKENKIIEFNGSEIQIVPYLSIQDKYDLIMITLQKAFDSGIYNDLKLKMYFELNLVYMYTNIVFQTEDRINENLLYDILVKSGFIDLVKQNISKDELSELWNLMKLIETKMFNYKGSLLAFLGDAIQELPEKASKALDLLKQIDPELLKRFGAGPMSMIMPILDKTFEDTVKEN